MSLIQTPCIKYAHSAKGGFHWLNRAEYHDILQNYSKNENSPVATSRDAPPYWLATLMKDPPPPPNCNKYPSCSIFYYDISDCQTEILLLGGGGGCLSGGGTYYSSGNDGAVG